MKRSIQLAMVGIVLALPALAVANGPPIGKRIPPRDPTTKPQENAPQKSKQPGAEAAMIGLGASVVLVGGGLLLKRRMS